MGMNGIRLYGLTALALLLTAPTASGQFTQVNFSAPPIAERYFVEASTGFWNPGADMTISSESLGIPGSDINFKNDLGLQDQRFKEVQVTLRPTKKAKLRFQYIPIGYSRDAVAVPRNIVFNGQLYRVGIPVTWSFDWKAYRFGYEYDAFYHNRAFVGFVLDVKYTDVRAQLATPLTAQPEFVHPQAPIPAVGGIARVYVVPNISVTGELTGFNLKWLPDTLIEENRGKYTDFDLYGTVNFTRNVGARFGYRSFDVSYLIDQDRGSFVLNGLYFGVVARY